MSAEKKIRLKAEIAQHLPATYDIDNLVVFECAARVEWANVEDPTEATELAKLAGIGREQSEVSEAPMVVNGRPRMLAVSAWMVHEGVNDNRQKFIASELEKVAGHISPTNFLVMDFNHSAVKSWMDEPKMLGSWFKGTYAFDEKAKQGAGAWGIHLQGAMAAWLFPEHANILLAEQQRHGAIRFSMAAIPESVEFGSDAQGEYRVLHNPIFFTNSALDVKPADGDALGQGQEGAVDSTTTDALTSKLLGQPDAASEAQAEETRLDALLELQAAAADAPAGGMNTQEEPMADNANELMALVEANKALETQVAALTEQVTALTGVQTKLDERETASEALQSELTTAQAEIARLTSELETVTTELNTRKAAEATEAAETVLAERLASLPEAFQKAFAKKSPEAQARLKDKWKEMDQAAFDFYVSEELLVGFEPTRTVGYVERSEREGIIPSAGESSDMAAKLAKHLKRS